MTVPSDEAIERAFQYIISMKADKIAGWISQNEGAASKKRPDFLFLSELLSTACSMRRIIRL